MSVNSCWNGSALMKTGSPGTYGCEDKEGSGPSLELHQWLGVPSGTCRTCFRNLFLFCLVGTRSPWSQLRCHQTWLVIRLQSKPVAETRVETWIPLCRWRAGSWRQYTQLGYFYASACKKVQENLGKAITVPLSAGKTRLSTSPCYWKAAKALAVIWGEIPLSKVSSLPREATLNPSSAWSASVCSCLFCNHRP